jgi:hypothetical protein
MRGCHVQSSTGLSFQHWPAKEKSMVSFLSEAAEAPLWEPLRCAPFQ